MYINQKRFEAYPELLEELRNNNGKNNAIENLLKKVNK